MKIILSPAKKMITDTDSIAPDGLPEFIEKTTEIQSWLKSKSKEELKTIWKCNDKITEQNFNRLENMDLYHLLTPAVLSFISPTGQMRSMPYSPTCCASANSLDELVAIAQVCSHSR